MTITYSIGRSLYVNVTNRCTCDCEFCVRKTADSVGGADSLWLEKEPQREEILADILKNDLTQYDELVFCGYGEPAERIYDVLWIAKKVKDEHKMPIRINTNGHAELIVGEDITPQMAGIIDTVSVSLNAKNAVDYVKMCHPKYGEDAYFAMLRFVRRSKKYVPNVIVTVIDTLPEQDIAACRKIAEDLGAKLRVRTLIE